MNELNDDNKVSQNVRPAKSYISGSLPYAFTGQGVAILSQNITFKNVRRPHHCGLLTFYELIFFY